MGSGSGVPIPSASFAGRAKPRAPQLANTLATADAIAEAIADAYAIAVRLGLARLGQPAGPVRGGYGCGREPEAAAAGCKTRRFACGLSCLFATDTTMGKWLWACTVHNVPQYNGLLQESDMLRLPSRNPVLVSPLSLKLARGL